MSVPAAPSAPSGGSAGGKPSQPQGGSGPEGEARQAGAEQKPQASSKPPEKTDAQKAEDAKVVDEIKKSVDAAQGITGENVDSGSADDEARIATGRQGTEAGARPASEPVRDPDLDDKPAVTAEALKKYPEYGVLAQQAQDQTKLDLEARKVKAHETGNKLLLDKNALEKGNLGGHMLEEFQPQVRGAVEDLAKKGYVIYQAGFNPENPTQQIISGDFKLTDKVRAEILNLDDTIEFTPITNPHNDKEILGTKISVTAKGAELEVIQKQLMEIAAVIPKKDQFFLLKWGAIFAGILGLTIFQKGSEKAQDMASGRA